MKRAFILVFSFYLLVSFASCTSNNTVFETSLQVPSATWLRFEPLQFTVDVPNAEDCYELHLALDIDTLRYRESALPLTLAIVSPEGETRTLYATVMLRSKDGHSLGQPDKDGHLVFSQRIREYFYFNQKGTHTVTVGQRTSRYEIKGIHRIDFSIRKAKLELPQ